MSEERSEYVRRELREVTGDDPEALEKLLPVALSPEDHEALLRRIDEDLRATGAAFLLGIVARSPEAAPDGHVRYMVGASSHGDYGVTLHLAKRMLLETIQALRSADRAEASREVLKILTELTQLGMGS